ncbi:Gfo/Idh/MocA family oxidoreductase [bacterium]|nr:Gfo/Idh/MocA family oxidoreductase [bacterium]
MRHEKKSRQATGRRDFIRIMTAAAAAPYFVPSAVFGATAPSNRITVGAIGTGRMGRGDLQDLLGHGDAQVVAVCDVDSNRLEDGRAYVEKFYAERSADGKAAGVSMYRDYRELVARADIDAVMICTPDHWHALPAMDAARAGKDIFLQKPLTYTLEEGRALSDTVRRYGRVFQVGSQQRSGEQFRTACELVRNGRIGKLEKVEVTLPTDPAGENRPVMPVPKQLDYEFWLGPCQWAPYTEERVHPPVGYDRPGWLRVEEYCLGMITGWGSHHMDIAHWGMGENAPLEVSGTATFPETGVWTVHGEFRIEYLYPGGVTVICRGREGASNGIRFSGTEGWVFVTRGRLDAEPKSLLKSVIGPNEVHLYRSRDHKGNWLECIKSRAETVAPVENGHRSCSACIVGHIAMKMQGTKLRWDAETERFVDNDAANRMLSRAMRGPWHL